VTDKTYRTATGKVLTDTDTEIDEIADTVAGIDYPVEELKQRRRGRPLLGSAPAEVVPVRLDPPLKAALEARADADDTNSSEIIRRALRAYLDVA
jgi:Ribbon-helix-helix protein, copG family